MAIGLLTAAMGLLFILLWAGIIGSPPQTSAAHQDPAWLGALFGLVFLLGGGAVVIKGAVGGDNRQSDLPASAPGWLRAVYRLMGLAIVCSLGVLMSWVAFGPGERHFTGSGAFLGDNAGRVAFGIFAGLIWLVLACMASARLRRRLARLREK